MPAEEIRPREAASTHIVLRRPKPLPCGRACAARDGRVGAPPYGERMTAWQAEPLSLFQAPEWTRLVGVFDLETTGIDVYRDRIVTAHVGVLDRDGHVVDARDWMADPGVEIPAAASAIHGVTTRRARAEGAPAGDVVAEVVESLRALFDAGIPVVAYNAPFDFSVLKYEALRHGIPPIHAPAPVIDPLIVDKTYDRWRRGKRTLSVVAAHYKVPLESAHEACADAVAAGRVALALAERFAAWMPPSLDDLHDRQVSWARAQAAGLTEYFVRIGRLEAEAPPLDGAWPIR